MKHSVQAICYSIVILIACSTTTAFASSASLFITKPSGTISQGDRITLDVKVKSTEQSINAVSGTVVFPGDMLRTVSVSRDNSILNIWTRDPNIGRNQISFEGVILNPGYRGDNGLIFHVTFEAKKSGPTSVTWSDGSVLANDGLGTNILSALTPTSFNITGPGALDLIDKNIAVSPGRRPLALPVITDYSRSIYSKDMAYLKGKGEPNALTQLAFENVTHKSFGEQFMDFIQSKKKKLTDVFVKNDDKGLFEYVSPRNLLAGVYNATPFLVDNEANVSKPGLGVQLLVNDSKIIKWLIIFINILILLIPIVGLIMVIYFIPWYSSRRMRIMKRRMGLEEEKIKITEHQLERQDEFLAHTNLPPINAEKRE